MIFDNIKLQISSFKLNIFGILNFQVGNIESKFLPALSVALYTFITVLIYLHFITNYVAILAREREEYFVYFYYSFNLFTFYYKLRSYLS